MPAQMDTQKNYGEHSVCPILANTIIFLQQFCSLLYSPFLCFQDPAVHSAIQFLDSQTVTDTYTIALMAYAYTLWDIASPQR